MSIGRVADIAITVATEGDADVPVLRRIFDDLGLVLGPAYIANGKGTLDKNIAGYNNAANYAPWVILRDLDSDAECAPTLKEQLIAAPGTYMCFRVAVRSVESWLMADRERLATFLSVPVARVPGTPDELEHPKREFVNLARRSRRRAIRDDIVPEPGTSRSVGPGYVGRIIEFAEYSWRPTIAQAVSPSLATCVSALRRWSDE